MVKDELFLLVRLTSWDPTKNSLLRLQAGASCIFGGQGLLRFAMCVNCLLSNSDRTATCSNMHSYPFVLRLTHNCAYIGVSSLDREELP